MELINTMIPGVFILDNFLAEDERGSFIKTFHQDIFLQNNLCSEFQESYYSISKKNVIRGMHFQLPPVDHEKLVFCPKGRILDVVLDLRKKSKMFGRYFSIEISDTNRYSIYIPKGIAHGFKVIEDNTITVYNVSTMYNKECDYGICWDSFGFDWQLDSPVISERDKGFKNFLDFTTKNPFTD